VNLLIQHITVQDQDGQNNMLKGVEILNSCREHEKEKYRKQKQNINNGWMTVCIKLIKLCQVPLEFK